MSHRTQIILADEQYERLREESRRSGLSLGELIRQAVDHMYGATHPTDVLRALDASFGSWTDRDEDGQAYVERLRRGMAARMANQYLRSHPGVDPVDYVIAATAA